MTTPHENDRKSLVELWDQYDPHLTTPQMLENIAAVTKEKILQANQPALTEWKTQMLSKYLVVEFYRQLQSDGTYKESYVSLEMWAISVLQAAEIGCQGKDRKLNIVETSDDRWEITDDSRPGRRWAIIRGGHLPFDICEHVPKKQMPKINF